MRARARSRGYVNNWDVTPARQPARNRFDGALCVAVVTQHGQYYYQFLIAESL